jgi:signal transduction histidine kinase
MVAATRRKQVAGSSRTSRITRRPTDGSDRSSGRSREAFERELRRLERRCESLREGAEEAQFAQADRLKTLSHDLRNPLNLIMLSTQMLARAIAPDHAGRHYINKITRGAEEMTHILEDFSDARLIDSGRFIVKRASQEVGPMIEQALGFARPHAESKGIQLSMEIAKDTPAVIGDRDRIVRVLSNMVKNAIWLSPKNGAITVRAQPDEDAALFSVTDTGAGIPREKRQLVFTCPVGQQGPVVQGAGIAFYVAKGVIEAHGGRVWFESEVGRGSTFFFTVPTTAPAPIN